MSIQYKGLTFYCIIILCMGAAPPIKPIQKTYIWSAHALKTAADHSELELHWSADHRPMKFQIWPEILFRWELTQLTIDIIQQSQKSNKTVLEKVISQDTQNRVQSIFYHDQISERELLAKLSILTSVIIK